MTAKKKNEFQSLRKRAELLLEKDGALKILSDVELAELVHELQVHQVELEIQNEQLRQTQDELLVSRQRFSDLFQRAPVGYLVLDENGVVQDVNETLCRMIDRLPDQVINRSVFDLVTESDRSWFEARYQALYKKPEKKSMELELDKAGGAKVSVSLQAVQYVVPGEDDLGGIPVLLLTVSDISDRKRAEDTLRLQAAMLQNIAEGINLVGLGDGIIKYANSRFESMFGYEPGELVGESVAVLNAPTEKTPKEISAEIIEVLKRDSEWHGEINNLKKDGTGFWCYADVSSFEHPEFGEVVISVYSDITEQKLAERALQEQTDLLATVFESSPNVLMLVNSDGRVEKINRAGSEFAGSPQEGLLGLLGGEVFQCINSFDGLSCGRNPVCTKCPIRTRMQRSLKKDETILNEEGRLTVRRDAHEIPMDFLISTVPVRTANSVKVLVTIVDITERKRSEERMRYQSYLLENVSDAIIATDSNFAIESWNRAAEEMYGWQESEVLGKTVEEVLKSDFQAPLNQVIDNFYKEGSWRGEALQYRKDGSPISVLSSVRLLQDEQGNLLRAIATNRDITERKRAEEALRQSELQNRTILRTALDGFWIVDPTSGQILEANDAYCQMSGYSRDEMLGMEVEDFEVVESVDELGTHAQKILKVGSDRFESIHKRKDGSLFYVEVSVRNLQNDGGRNFAFIHDITARKKAEQALRKSEEQYRLLFDEMLSGFALHEIICDENGKPVDYRFLAVNSAFEELTGLKADNIIGKTVLESLPVVESYWVERYGKVALEGVVEQFEGYSAGAGKHYEARAFCPEHGKFAVMFHDITERRQAEEQLNKVVERLNIATQAARLGIWDWDIQENELIWDDRMYELYGVKRKDFSGAYEAWLAGIHPDDRAFSDDVSRKARLGEMDYDTQFRVVWPDDSVHMLKAYGQVIRNEEEQPIRMIGVNYDITERIKVEDDLRVALAKYRTLFNAIPLGITVSDDQGKILETNAMSEKILGLSLAEHNRRTIDDSEWNLVRPDGTLMHPSEYASVRALQEQRLVENVEMGIVKPGGEISWLSVTADTLPLEGYGIVIVYSDISERKRSEEELKRLLQEKEILLAEVHHRVKNNLQVITSLLNLQTEGVKDKEILRMLEESRNRIQSMTLVHEQLYRAREYAHIDFGIYADQLVSTLFNMYEVNPNQISFELDADQIFLELDKAIPCGLILNELITNTLKYAFPNGRKGKLWVRLRPHNNKMIYKVGDNGVGISENINLEVTQSLGLQLVKLLSTHDLRGSVEMKLDKGTQFQIEFPVSHSA